MSIKDLLSIPIKTWLLIGSFVWAMKMIELVLLALLFQPKK